MQTPLEISSVVFKPILIRAVVALAFGLTTVFVAEPGLTWMKVMFALYLAFSGSAMWEYLRRDPVPVAMRSPLSLAAAAWMLGVIVLLFLGSPAAVGVAAGAALVLGGVAELVAWARHRREFIPARDQLWTGLVGLLSGGGVVVAALQGFGFAMGPFRMYDVVGIDLEWRARELAGKGQDEPEVQVDNRLCELGRFGQKSRMGYYRYAEGSRQAEHDPEVDALVQRESERLGYERREIGSEEILERCLLALVNEGAKILEEGMAESSADIDTVYLYGYGFPAEVGGPMTWADRQGLPAIRERLNTLAERHGEHWQPAGLIDSLATLGGRFADYKKEA